MREKKTELGWEKSRQVFQVGGKAALLKGVYQDSDDNSLICIEEVESIQEIGKGEETDGLRTDSRQGSGSNDGSGRETERG